MGVLKCYTEIGKPLYVSYITKILNKIYINLHLRRFVFRKTSSNKFRRIYKH